MLSFLHSTSFPVWELATIPSLPFHFEHWIGPVDSCFKFSNIYKFLLTFGPRYPKK